LIAFGLTAEQPLSSTHILERSRLLQEAIVLCHSKFQVRRLYGIDRKLPPLHIAVAMQSPPEVIAAMIRPDTTTGMSTVKTLMKNSKKKYGMNIGMNIGMGKKMQK